MLDHHAEVQIIPAVSLREAMQSRRVPGFGFFARDNDFEQLLADIPEANTAESDVEHSQVAFLS